MNTAHLLLNHVLHGSQGAGDYVLVLDSEGLEDLPQQLDNSGKRYAVKRVDTELGLRHLLWAARGAPLIAVLPETVAKTIQASPDLVRRARGQRVHALTNNDVLELVLGVRVVGADSPELQQLALENLDRLNVALNKRTLPTVIDKRLLTELLVDVSVGEHVRTRAPGQLLAAWVQSPPHWSPEVVALLREALPRIHGDAGQLLAWALERPDTGFRDLVTVGAVLTVESAELPKQAWGPLWDAASLPPIQLDRRIARQVLVALVEETLGALGDAAGTLLVAADRLARETLSLPVHHSSPVLPLAFSGRCEALAKRAAEARAISAAEISWLQRHSAARLHRADLAVIEAMARLSRYLDQPWSPRPGLVDQVRDFQQNGAFAELAMLHLRRALSASAHFHVEAQKLLAAARARRDKENLHFAQTLAGDYEAELHRDGVIPLHRLWKRVVSPVWESDAKTKLFLIVLDGCNYPVFLELLASLAGDSAFPLGMAADADGHVVGLQGLAPLPTVTSHARGAIFLGQLPEDPLVAETVFRDQDEARTDPARFKQNTGLGQRTRRLFLKGELSDGGQGLFAALDDDGIDVVAAVFNAVDDQIGSANTGATLRMAPEDIAGFKPALQRALRAGRRVLVTADHGHSPWVDRALRVGTGAAPRYLPLGPKEQPPEGFLEIDVKGLGGPPGRRAFAWKSGVYLGGPQVGFHGGCSLEEMVVPMAWLVRDGLQADEPAWWFGRGTMAEPASQPRPVLPPIYTPTPPPEAPRPPPQMSLFDPAEKAGSLPVPPEVLAKLTADEKAVLVLLRENGSARASELATRLNKNPGRLNGLMHALRRALHDKGLRLFTDESLPSGETLYRYQGGKPEGGG